MGMLKMTDVNEIAERSVRDGYASGDRHGWIDTLCSRLERMTLGKYAAAWLAGEYGPIPRVSCAVIVLPQWVWSAPAIKVGRKSMAADGGALLMPIRITWMTTPLLVVERGQSVNATWSGSGLGHNGSGSTIATALDNGAAGEDTSIPNEISPEYTAASLPRHIVMATLRKMIDDGRAAKWEALTSLEPYIRLAVNRAHSSVAIEVAGSPDLAVDIIEAPVLDSIVDKMLLGTDETEGDPFAVRLLDRCSGATTFTKVDPLKYIITALRSEAETAIRRDLGDPHIGRKIRALARDMNTADIKAVVAEYRVRYPNELLAAQRAEAAMTVASSAPTSCGDFSGMQDEVRGDQFSFNERYDYIEDRIDAEAARSRHRRMPVRTAAVA